MHKLSTIKINDSYYAFLIIGQEGNEKSLETKLFGYSTGKISRVSPSLRAEITWVFNKNKQGKEFLRERFLKFIGKGSNPIPVKAENLRSLLKKGKYLLLEESLSPRLKEGINRYLDDFQISITVKEFKNCPYCAMENRITLMNSKQTFFGMNNAEICQLCALKELQRELKGKGVLLSPAIIDYLKKLLQQSKSVSKCIDILHGNQKYGSGSIIKEVEKILGEYKEPTPITQLKKYLPDYIQKNLVSRSIESLLPVQVMALKSGLLHGKSQLIVAETSAGKTLVGELASLKQILVHRKKVLYLSPLVALANTKYESFKKNFKIEGFKIGIRVGIPRLKLKSRKMIPDSKKLDNKDIIVGTYEGFDQLLRSGYKFTNIGLVIIDEIQTLQEAEDDDRGPDLDGLITRLKLQKHSIQLLALSATIGNPEELAKLLGLELVQYKGRPIPLEVHVLLSPSDIKKKERLAEIILEEKKHISSYGYRGQVIVFTNSRRKTKEIRDYLRNSRIKAANYHSGLHYSVRKQVEEEFESGQIDVVVATYALGAGVDFPASVVVFESLQMGKDLLIDKPNIFFQMMGRAGRLGKHDKGKVILLATPYPPNASVQMTEIEIAMNLLKASYQNVNPEYDLDITATQLLATLSAFKALEKYKWEQSFNLLIGAVGTFDDSVNYLMKNRLVVFKDNKYIITELGRAGALSFLKVKDVLFVIKKLKTLQQIEIAILMEPFENIHLSSYLHSYLEKTLKNRISTRFFSSNVLDILDSASVKAQKLDKKSVNFLIQWSQEFFNCGCEDMPYCNHGLINVNKKLLDLRIRGNGPESITRILEKDYGLYAFSGDVLRWIESILYKLEGIKKISLAVNKKVSKEDEIGLDIIEEAIQDPKQVSKEKLDEILALF
jgi:helicase